MNLTDFPIELQVSFLLESNLEDLLNYSLINKQAYEICSTNEFLHQYVYQKYHLDLNRIPGETSWEALRYLFYLMDEADCSYYDDLLYRTRYRTLEQLAHFLGEIIGLDYPQFLEMITETVTSHLYAVYDLSEFDEIRVLYHTFKEAKRMGDLKLINLLLRYYDPDELLYYAREHPDKIQEMVEKTPELAWTILKWEISMPKETEDFLLSVLPQTFRYNRPETLPYLTRKLELCSREAHLYYPEEEVEDMKKTYQKAISRYKKLVRPDIAAEF